MADAQERLAFVTSELMKFLREEPRDIPSIAEELGIHPSTAYRWLRAFEKFGILVLEHHRNGNGRFVQCFRLSPNWGGK